MKLYSEEQLREVVRLSLEDAEKSVVWSKEWYPSKLADRIMQDLTPIELPSDEEIEPVKALEEDSDWYLIPNKLCDEFKNDTYNEEMVESGGFDDKWWEYKTGGDLNLIQLYVKIQGGSK